MHFSFLFVSRVIISSNFKDVNIVLWHEECPKCTSSNREAPKAAAEKDKKL